MAKRPAPTERHWLNATVTGQLRFILGKRESKRKLLLWGCACARQTWHLLKHNANRRAIETSERYADGQATKR
jgi:hypothetical protein